MARKVIAVLMVASAAAMMYHVMMELAGAHSTTMSVLVFVSYHLALIGILIGRWK